MVFYDAHPMPHKFPRHKFGGSMQYAAWWPADRLAAIEAPQEGAFTSAAMNLRGNRIILNLQSDRTGGIQVELRDEKFRAIAGHTFADSDKLFGDEQTATATWNGKGDVSEYKDQKMYLCFRLRAAKLFSICANQ